MLRRWDALHPTQRLTLGFLTYIAIGYMTLSSFLLLSRGPTLSEARVGVLRTEFSLPEGLEILPFVRQVVLFTVAIEALGAVMPWLEFRSAGVPQPLWSGLFHSVSAFATAGFSLFDDSLERFRANGVVNITVGVLAYLGATGFIVLQDGWRAIRLREHRLTFTSKVILAVTGSVFVAGTGILYLVDEAMRGLPTGERWLAAAFQTMTASTTAGFNTIPMPLLSTAALVWITAVMVVGASPCGTGGGIKTTTVTALLAVLLSVVRGRSSILFWRHEVPLIRVLAGVASATLYLSCLAAGIFTFSLLEGRDFLALVFEAASGLGTVGLSMGITADLGSAAKGILVLLMFVGRLGPLTLGLALLRRDRLLPARARNDLAV